MERIGCGIWLALLFGLPLLGMLTATKRHNSVALGLCCGVSGWFALVSGYMVVLSILDWRRRGEIRPENDVPKWVVPLAWLVFITSSAACVMLLERFA